MRHKVSNVVAASASCIALALIGLLPSGAKAGVTVGQWDSANCLPFICPSNAGNTLVVYQQVYNASAFTGVTPFNLVQFELDPMYAVGGSDDASYTVSFSTTSKPILGLDSNYLNNIGADSMTFGMYSISGGVEPKLSLWGDRFVYDPLKGNLLMTVTINSLNATLPDSLYQYFKADSVGAETSRLYDTGSGSGGLNDIYGLVTEFSYVPEPGAVAFGVVAVCGMLGLLARKRRR